jgi:hypothetical protein
MNYVNQRTVVKATPKGGFLNKRTGEKKSQRAAFIFTSIVTSEIMTQ